jgi:hypothetical protein
MRFSNDTDWVSKQDTLLDLSSARVEAKMSQGKGRSFNLQNSISRNMLCTSIS